MPQVAVMQGLFDKVAWRYDLTNRVLSAGRDRRWREAVAKEVLSDKPNLVLDACSGTADQMLAICQAEGFHGKVISADISWEMLRRGREKVQAALPGGQDKDLALLADVHRMALRAETFDCATICFGVRNFSNVLEGLTEIGRVLRPGGKLVILEFTTPTNPFVWKMYRLYLTKVLPYIGGLLTRQTDAYRYLASSIEGFLTPEQLGDCLEQAGFKQVRHRFLSLGVVAITTGIRNYGDTLRNS